MYNINLLGEQDLLKQEMVLRYFYLIDPQRTAEELSAGLSLPEKDASPQEVSIFFNSIFEKIFSTSSLYNEYIDTKNFYHAGFFGEPGCKTDEKPEFAEHLKRLQNLRVFLKLSLRNQCITDGFFHSLEKENAGNYEKLSAANDDFFKSGYFGGAKIKEEKLNSYQYYNAKSKSIRALGEDSFSWKTLVDSSLHKNGPKIPEKGSLNLQVPHVYKYWTYYFFTKPEIRALSNDIAEKTDKETSDKKKLKRKCDTTYTHYRKIYEDSKSEECKLYHPMDKFIFHMMNEYYFGFSTLSYINDLMKKVQIETPTEDDGSYMKRYRGEIFESILKRLPCIPMPYSRHLFLMYCLESLRYNKDVQCNFFTNKPDGVLKDLHTAAKLSGEALHAKGLELIPQFLITLNKTTLPILASLWVVVIEKLIPDNGLMLSLYGTYIESFDKLLYADFTKLSFEDMEECCSNNKMGIPQYDIDSPFLLDKLMGILGSKYAGGPDNFLEDIYSEKDFLGMLRCFLNMPKDDPGQPLENRIFQDAGWNEDDKKLINNFRWGRSRDILNLFSSEW